jgi:hypothetical protein
MIIVITTTTIIVITTTTIISIVGEWPADQSSPSDCNGILIGKRLIIDALVL